MQRQLRSISPLPRSKPNPSSTLTYSVSSAAQVLYQVSPDGQRFYYSIEPNARSRTLRVVLNWKARLADL